MSQLADSVRLWVQQKIDWCQWCHHVKNLGLFRDTLHSWVTNVPEPCNQIQWFIQKYIAIRNQVALGYVPLARKIADTYGFNEHSQLDLRQVAFTGVVHAIERFNNCGPATFPNFAGRWIRQRILHHITRKSSIIYVSHSVLDAERKITQREKRRGETDQSPQAQQVKQTCELRHVALLDSCDTFEFGTTAPADLCLTVLPRSLKQLVIAKFGLLEHARPNASADTIEAEGVRQKT